MVAKNHRSKKETYPRGITLIGSTTTVNGRAAEHVIKRSLRELAPESKPVGMPTDSADNDSTTSAWVLYHHMDKAHTPRGIVQFTVDEAPLVVDALELFIDERSHRFSLLGLAAHRYADRIGGVLLRSEIPPVPQLSLEPDSPPQQPSEV